LDKLVKTKELYDCTVPYLAPLFEECEYPWEMLPKIKDGDICVFEWYNAGTRNDEIVLTQSREYDPEYGGKYTIKRYHSEKVVSEEGWQHTKVELRPLNPDFDTIELTEDDDIRTIGIFKCVLLLNN
jgi:hypothetical protein